MVTREEGRVEEEPLRVKEGVVGVAGMVTVLVCQSIIGLTAASHFLPRMTEKESTGRTTRSSQVT